jgi:outer membrane lipoprotein LolB
MARLIRVLASGVLVVLAGCHTAPVRLPAAHPWPERKAELQQRERYELKGRVAVAAGGEGFNARLRWTQDGSKSQVSLQGPLGTGGVELVADGDTLSIQDAHGERMGDEAAREELRSRMGFEPPLASLRYWVLGVPDPSQPAEEVVDESQHLTHLTQGGWQIEYPAYMPVNDQSLPQRITLQAADVRVRLLVDSWSP